MTWNEYLLEYIDKLLFLFACDHMTEVHQPQEDSSYTHGTTETAKQDLLHTLQMLSANQINDKLHNNTDRLFLSELRKKEVYLTKNTCVDGREDTTGVSSFWGAAGTLWASYLALNEFFDGKLSEHEIIDLLGVFIGDTKIYLHDDTHAVEHNHGKHPCDCGHIWCGAVDRMLTTKKVDDQGMNPWWFSATWRELFWQFLKEHADIKVLEGNHAEQSIIWVKNKPRVDHEIGEEYIDLLQKNKKVNEHGEEEQDFGYHETGRNLIIDFLSHDLAQFICDQADHELLKEQLCTLGSHNATLGAEKNLVTSLHYWLKEHTMRIADQHTWLTAVDLAPAKKCLDEGNVIYIEKLSHKGKHRFSLNTNS